MLLTRLFLKVHLLVTLKELKHGQQEYFHSLDSEEFISMILKITVFKWEEADVLLALPIISSLKIKVYQLKRALKALFYYGAYDI